MNISKLKVDYDTPLEKQLEGLGVRNYLDLTLSKSLFPPSPDGYIYDVEDGAKMMGKSTLQCEKIFKKSGRRGLTVIEGLALLREEPKLLKHHNVDLCGSRGESADEVPGVYLAGGDCPGLCGFVADYSHDHWGSASCGSGSSDSGDLGSLESRTSALEKFQRKVENMLRINGS